MTDCDTINLTYRMPVMLPWQHSRELIPRDGDSLTFERSHLVRFTQYKSSVGRNGIQLLRRFVWLLNFITGRNESHRFIELRQRILGSFHR